MSDVEHDLMVNFKSIENEKHADKVKETVEVHLCEMSHHMQTGSLQMMPCNVSNALTLDDLSA